MGATLTTPTLSYFYSATQQDVAYNKDNNRKIKNK